MMKNSLKAMPCSFQATVASSDGTERRSRPGFPAWIVGAIARIARWGAKGHRRRASIAQLHSLSDRQLRDIGIERYRIAEVVDAMQAREARGEAAAHPDGVNCRF